MPPRKRNDNNRDLPDNLYTAGKDSYRYRHPTTGQFHGMGTDRQAAIAAARKLNAMLAVPQQSNLVARVMGSDNKTWADLVHLYRTTQQAQQDHKASTTQAENYRLEHVEQGLGSIALQDTTQRLLSNWLDENWKGNPYTKHRGTLIKLMALGIAKGWFPDGTQNLAAATLPMKEGKKRRQALTMDQYCAIHAKADPWLQVAMDFALVTLQRLGDIAMAKYEDIKGGELYVVQNKTERHGERAYLRIAIGASLAEILQRSRALPPLCPFIVHRRPDRKRPFAGQEHWAQVRAETLSKSFSRARDATGLFGHLKPGEAPTFHEIRGLGGAQYLTQGYSKEYVNLLMGHTTQRMTDIYTEQHINWTHCAAELDL